MDGQVMKAVMEIGQKVRVRRLRDRVPQEVIKKLGAVGVVRQFKVVDGQGVGLLVQFDDQYSTWFFEDELEQYD
ncbi:MAG: cytochrome B6 [Leptolyngbya sp. ERB_1_1]